MLFRKCQRKKLPGAKTGELINFEEKNIDPHGRDTIQARINNSLLTFMLDRKTNRQPS